MASRCPCINVTDVLQKFQNCVTVSGELGTNVYGAGTGACLPLTYGSNVCAKHDALFNPSCQVDPSKYETVPASCDESWCYVDKDACMLTKELLYRSNYFKDIDLYYSYSTCNSSAESWLNALTTEPFKSIETMRIALPELFPPFYSKQVSLDYNGTQFEGYGEGPKYYDDSFPFQGACVDYIKTVADMNVEITDIKFEARSRGSDKVHATSKYTASARDVQVGLKHLAVGTFWITIERLKMVSFTIPVAADKIVLVTKRVDGKDKFIEQFSRVLYPFDYSVWGMLFLSLIIVSALNLWFASPKATNQRPWTAFRNDEWRYSSWRRKTFIFVRYYTESFLETGVYFAGAAASQDFRSSLSSKFLMLGYSLMILIVVSCYTANLAAALVKSGTNDHVVRTMEVAIDRNLRICAHPGVRGELELYWPLANFVFNKVTSEYDGVFELLKQGKCDLLAIGYLESIYNKKIMDQFCEYDIAFTQDVLLDIPIAFPVRTDLAAGISSMFLDAKREGVTFENILDEKYKYTPMCSVEIDVHNTKDDQLTATEMASAFLALYFFAFVGVFIKLFDRKNVIKATSFIITHTSMKKKNAKRFMDAAKFAHLDIDDNGYVGPKEHEDDNDDDKLEHTSSQQNSTHSNTPNLSQKPYHRLVSFKLQKELEPKNLVIAATKKSYNEQRIEECKSKVSRYQNATSLLTVDEETSINDYHSIKKPNEGQLSEQKLREIITELSENIKMEFSEIRDHIISDRKMSQSRPEGGL